MANNSTTNTGGYASGISGYVHNTVTSAIPQHSHTHSHFNYSPPLTTIEDLKRAQDETNRLLFLLLAEIKSQRG